MSSNYFIGGGESESRVALWLECPKKCNCKARWLKCSKSKHNEDGGNM